MIIADESISKELILKLINNGYDVLSVKENYQGITDNEIIEITKKHNAILITEETRYLADILRNGKGLIPVLAITSVNESETETMENNFLHFLKNFVENKNRNLE